MYILEVLFLTTPEDVVPQSFKIKEMNLTQRIKENSPIEIERNRNGVYREEDPSGRSEK